MHIENFWNKRMGTIIIFSSVLAVLGIIGSFVPALPGPILSFSALLLLFFFPSSDKVPFWAVIIFGLAMVIILVADYVAPILGAKYFGSSKMGIWGAILGALLGILFFPPLGIFLGAFLGAVFGEAYGGKKLQEALRSGAGVLLGSVSVIILQVVYSVTLAVYFFLKAF